MWKIELAHLTQAERCSEKEKGFEMVRKDEKPSKGNGVKKRERDKVNTKCN